MYGHVQKLAQAEKKGVEAAGGEAKVFQVQETLPAEVLKAMWAPPKADVPVLNVADLEFADGILFGIPTRYGSLPTQLKAMWDATGQLWMKGGLVGKPAGVFFSTSGPGGGQETTALTFLPHLVHHGMIYVPIGYVNKAFANLKEVTGGSPYGAGTFSSVDGSRQPTEAELGLAEDQGKRFAQLTAALVKGRGQ